MKYEKFKKQSLIFSSGNNIFFYNIISTLIIGDTGDKFYIILKGRVSVLIPGFFKDGSKRRLNTNIGKAF